MLQSHTMHLFPEKQAQNVSIGAKNVVLRRGRDRQAAQNIWQLTMYIQINRKNTDRMKNRKTVWNTKTDILYPISFSMQRALQKKKLTRERLCEWVSDWVKDKNVHGGAFLQKKSYVVEDPLRSMPCRVRKELCSSRAHILKICRKPTKEKAPASCRQHQSWLYALDNMVSHYGLRTNGLWSQLFRCLKFWLRSRHFGLHLDVPNSLH